MALTAAQVAGAAVAGGFTGSDVGIAVAVAKAESGWDPNQTSSNTNGTIDHGLWQINTVNSGALALGDWRDPNTNGKMAKMIKDQQGWRAWTVYKTGAYLPFLPAGQVAAGNPAGAPGGAPGAAPADSSAAESDPLGIGRLMEAHLWVRIVAVAGGGVIVFVAIAKLTGLSVPSPASIGKAAALA